MRTNSAASVSAKVLRVICSPFGAPSDMVQAARAKVGPALHPDLQVQQVAQQKRKAPRDAKPAGKRQKKGPAMAADAGDPDAGAGHSDGRRAAGAAKHNAQGTARGKGKAQKGEGQGKGKGKEQGKALGKEGKGQGKAQARQGKGAAKGKGGGKGQGSARQVPGEEDGGQERTGAAAGSAGPERNGARLQAGRSKRRWRGCGKCRR